MNVRVIGILCWVGLFVGVGFSEENGAIDEGRNPGDFQPNSIFGLATNKNVDPTRTAGAVKWLRMDFDYGSDFETEARGFDKAVNRAQTNKMMVLGILNPRRFIHEYEKGEKPLKGWIDWVRKVISRYTGRVQYWEICNEPNNWKMPDVYVTLAKSAYVAGRQADPGCSMGAFSSCLEMPFFEYCLKAGIGDYFDFVTIHPYQWSHSFNEAMLLDDIHSLEALLDTYKCRRPIWITEIGWPTHPKGGSSVELQGQIAGQVLCTLAGVEKYKTFWHTLGDWPAEPTDAEGYFGLFDAAGRPKPAFYSYYAVSKLLSNARGLGRADVPGGCTGWQYLLADGRMGLSIWKSSRPSSHIRVKLFGLAGSEVLYYEMNPSQKTLQAKDGYVEIDAGPSPILLVYPTDVKCKLRSRPLLAQAPKSTDPIFLTRSELPVLYSGKKEILPFGIVNLTNKEENQTVICHLPTGWGATIKKEFTAKAGEETRSQLEFTVPAYAKAGSYHIKIKSPNCRHMEIPVEVVPQLEIDVLPIHADENRKDIPIEMIIRNPTQKRIIGNLNILPKETVRPDPNVIVDLPSGKEIRISKTLSTYTPWIEFQGTLGKQEYKLKRMLNSTFIPRSKGEIHIDGDVKEWRTNLPYHLGRIEQVQQIRNWWSGEEDLSADVWFRWDETYLYFASEVTDDIHRQPTTDGSTWMGDGFQIAFAVDDTYAYEFCLSLTNEGPQLYRLWTIHDNAGLVAAAKVAVKREPKRTYYEVALPWSEIQPIQPKAGGHLRLNFILNENDGTTREGYLECRPGIGDTKSVRQWYEWRLGD